MSDWGRTTENVRWSMTDGGSDAGGKAMMIHACRQNSEAWMGEFKDGFHRTQASGSARALFDECARENQGRLYQIGRSFLARAERSLKKTFYVKISAAKKIKKKAIKKKKISR